MHQGAGSAPNLHPLLFLFLLLTAADTVAPSHLKVASDFALQNNRKGVYSPDQFIFYFYFYFFFFYQLAAIAFFSSDVLVEIRRVSSHWMPEKTYETADMTTWTF